MSMRTRSAIGRQNRAKGQAWERSVCQRFGAALGLKLERDSGETANGRRGDVRRASGARGPFPFAVECRCGALPSVLRAVRDAASYRTDGEYAVAALRFDGAGGRPAVELVAMPLGDFERLIARLAL